MKNHFLAFLALCLITLGLSSCRSNHVTLVQTSHMVTHPAARKGDTLVFEVPPQGEGPQEEKPPLHVFFQGQNKPCAQKDLVVPVGVGSVECKVTQDVAVATRDYYYVGTEQPKSESVTGASKVGRCPPWCSLVVIGKGGPGAGAIVEPLVPLPRQSSPYPAVEIAISREGDGAPDAGDASALQGQPVTWFTSSPDVRGWTVQFDDDICEKGKTIVSKEGEVAYCTLKANVKAGFYTYTITIDGSPTGQRSKLYVIPASGSAGNQ